MESNYLCAKKRQKWSFSYITNTLSVYIQHLKFKLWNKSFLVCTSDKKLCSKKSHPVENRSNTYFSYLIPNLFLDNTTRVSDSILNCLSTNTGGILPTLNFSAVNNNYLLRDICKSLVAEKSFFSVSALTKCKKRPLIFAELWYKTIALTVMSQVSLVAVEQNNQVAQLSYETFEVVDIDNNNHAEMCDTNGCYSIMDARDHCEDATVSCSVKENSVKVSHCPKQRSRRKHNRRRRRRSSGKAKSAVNKSLEVSKNCRSSSTPNWLAVDQANGDLYNKVKVDIVVSPDVENLSIEHSLKMKRPHCENVIISFIMGGPVDSESDNETDDGWDVSDGIENGSKDPYLECDLVDRNSVTKLSVGDRLAEINRKWEQEINDVPILEPSGSAVSKKVWFPKDKELFRIHHMRTWVFAYQAARIGPWETYSRDWHRFQKRIDDTGKIIGPILQPVHRANVYSKISEWT